MRSAQARLRDGTARPMAACCSLNVSPVNVAVPRVARSSIVPPRPQPASSTWPGAAGQERREQHVVQARERWGGRPRADRPTRGAPSACRARRRSRRSRADAVQRDEPVVVDAERVARSAARVGARGPSPAVRLAELPIERDAGVAVASRARLEVAGRRGVEPDVRRVGFVGQVVDADERRQAERRLPSSAS